MGLHSKVVADNLAPHSSTIGPSGFFVTASEDSSSRRHAFLLFICYCRATATANRFQALVISSQRASDIDILKSTKLICFLGTPHRGSHLLEKALPKTALTLMSLTGKELPKNVKKSLQPRDDESFRINSDFMRVRGQVLIVNFYEQKSRRLVNDLVCSAHSGLQSWSSNISGG